MGCTKLHILEKQYTRTDLKVVARKKRVETNCLGSASLVTDNHGGTYQALHFTPFGCDFIDIKQPEWYNEMHRFTGYYKDFESGMDYANARYKDIDFKSPDDMWHLSPDIQSYHYCRWNPIMYVDRDGKETHVAMNEDGTYQVIGGELNKDRNIYVYTQDKDGNYTVRGNSIGISSSTTSFYNADADNGKGAWAVGSIINPNDKSGYNFLGSIFGSSPPMFNDYMANAGNGEKYDFKTTNGTDKAIEGIDTYRGMPIGVTGNGQTIYSSARDIGNMTAGYVAGANGMSWTASRVAFDAFQTKVSGKPSIESISTRNAEYYGWRIGSNIMNNTPTQKANNLLKSIWNWITK
ncbi:MAG: hypothetical protein LBB53_02580 [Prevotellaceae bacterium]|jgi:RHS repeat-associated protein|nr:hypothetical protein [Prevotellaceae bacterium]